jgi:hypothetical protein
VKIAFSKCMKFRCKHYRKRYDGGQCMLAYLAWTQLRRWVIKNDLKRLRKIAKVLDEFPEACPFVLEHTI